MKHLLKGILKRDTGTIDRVNERVKIVRHKVYRVYLMIGKLLRVTG